MTRTFNEHIRCERCGFQQTAETDFERWMRNHSQLNSRHGIVRFDLDVLLHRYKVIDDGKGSRDIQCLMFIEVKTYMATPSPCQRDTLSMFNQVLRNGKPNVHSVPRHHPVNRPVKVYSHMLKRQVTLRMFGGHLLQMDGSSPENSSRMLWDNQDIDVQWLLELLRFERHPDRPHLMLDHRRRSRAWSRIPKLPGF